jgi:lycopene cyclase domain-containing protein
LEAQVTYTGLAITFALAAILADIELFQSKLIFTKRFWASYSIIIFFQLLTNWWLTSRKIVMYSPDAIIGWRIASAPVEDLFFGFSLVLLVLILWDKD